MTPPRLSAFSLVLMLHREAAKLRQLGIPDSFWAERQRAPMPQQQQQQQQRQLQQRREDVFAVWCQAALCSCSSSLLQAAADLRAPPTVDWVISVWKVRSCRLLLMMFMRLAAIAAVAF